MQDSVLPQNNNAPNLPGSLPNTSTPPAPPSADLKSLTPNEISQFSYKSSPLPALKKDPAGSAAPQKEFEIAVRTLKSDIEELESKGVKEPKPQVPTPPQIPGGTAKEAQFESRATPQAPQVVRPEVPKPPTLPKPPIPTAPSLPKAPTPPVLKIPPKQIPPKEIPMIPARPLPKVFPTWLKLGLIAVVIIIVTFFGLYAYWKFFVQQKPAPQVQVPVMPPATTTPLLPTLPEVINPVPVKFFNKLPSKSVAIDLVKKDSVTLKQALLAEAQVSEVRASVKQIVLTYQNKPLTASDFFILMQIFTPKDFLSNYTDGFALALFSQKEGARPIVILKPKDSALSKTQMQSWEKSTLSSDTLPLFLNLQKIPVPGVFKEYVYAGQVVRYLNTSTLFASLNYTNYNGDLIITTSSAAMFVILQDLTGLTLTK